MKDGIVDVWSCGGGTQSTAIAVLILIGKLRRPDYVIMTDTGRERTSTWDYLFEYTAPALSEIGLDIHLVSKDVFATKDLWGGEDRDILLLPTYKNIDGVATKSPGYCSGEWKRDVAKRYMRKVLGITMCLNWMGISTDEMNRVRTSREMWCQLHYPLIFEMGMNREACVQLVKDYGWPSPPRSSCWLCPHMSDVEWVDIKNNYPADFAKAGATERQFRAMSPGEYLHRSLTPIEEVEFSNSTNSTEGSTGCDSGVCFV